MKRLSVFTLIFFFIGCVYANAQFYSPGTDPGGTRWMQVKTPHFKLIYPEGLDSLSRVYGTLLEKYYDAEEWSSGYSVKGKYRSRLPVILHPFNAEANGSVMWAPRKMDLLTVPNADGTGPMRWEKNLAIHEMRHVSQLNAGYSGAFVPLNWLFGQMVPGAVSSIYANIFFLEGDAVVAETGLSDAGRGRTADFLNYYRFAFDNGDYRNWYRWRYGSFKYYSPNHYALGYATIAGARYLYNDPLFTSNYFGTVTRKPLRMFNLQKYFREISGKKFRDSYDDIMHAMNGIWQYDASRRAPYLAGRQVVETPVVFTDYKDNLPADGGIIVSKSSFDKARALYLVKADGKEKKIARLSTYAGKIRIRPSDGRLYWCETVPDPRWELRKKSVIRYLDRGGNVRNLTSGGKLYNVALSGDGKFVSAAEYPDMGGTSLVVLDADSGKRIKEFRAPDSLQVVHSVWLDDDIYLSGVSRHGFGIYRLDLKSGRIENVLGPRQVTIGELGSHKGKLSFLSDRNGSDELYLLNPRDGELTQMTSAKYGISNYSFSPGGDSLYYSSITEKGNLLFSLPVSQLKPETVSFGDVHRYIIADKLSEQEKSLAARRGQPFPDTVRNFSTVFTGPKRYSKLTHIPNIHSWAPFYFNSDDVESTSMDIGGDEGALGAIVMFQNHLGSASGSLGYAYQWNMDEQRFRNAGHFKLAYSGLYPVFEINVDFGDRLAIQYYRRAVTRGGSTYIGNFGIYSDNPSLRAEARAYIPLDFSSGGHVRGIIPQINFSIQNDVYNTGIAYFSGDGNMSESADVPLFYGPNMQEIPHFIKYVDGKQLFAKRLSFSVRGYSMLSRARNCDYPEYGIGAEIGLGGRLGLEDIYTPAAYSYIYGYLPGIFRGQGMRLSGIYQRQLGNGSIPENIVSTYPRGLYGMGLNSFLGQNSSDQMKFTADYAIPVYLGDIDFLSPVAYIRNFVITPHFDYSAFNLPGRNGLGGLFSAGAEITARMPHFLWIPFDTRLGFTLSYNGGPSFDYIKNSGVQLQRHYLGLVFNMNM